jgi:outer membrane translocation and assembly module TamA
LFSAQTTVSFDAIPPTEAGADLGTSNLRGLALGWAHDTHDDIFTPSKGQASSAVFTAYPEALGASFDARALSLKWTGYRGLGKGVMGLRTKFDLSFGAPPFYLRPFVAFRGISALRYAGEQVASLEAEYRRPVGRHWDALAFAGIGSARADYRGIDSSKTVSAAGVGVRFKAVKLFGLTLGLDVAQGPDGQAFYIQIGNAWTN